MPSVTRDPKQYLQMGELERLVMGTMWGLIKPISVERLAKYVNEDNQKTLAYNTYRTVMLRLVYKGLLKRSNGKGSNGLYSVAMSREQFVEAVIREIVGI